MHPLLHLFIFSFACIAGCWSASPSESRFLHHLNKPEVIRPAGNYTTILKSNWDALKGLSIRHVTLAPGAVREPHWHTNANQLSYCLRGTAIITLVFYSGVYQTFSIGAGQAYYVPSGLLHHAEAVDNSTAVEFLTVYSNEAMEEFAISTALGAMTDRVLGNTFQLDAHIFKDVIKRDNVPAYFGFRPTVKPEVGFALFGPYKFDVGKLMAAYKTSEGSMKVLDQRVWPVLDGVSMSTLHIGASSTVAPHWHPIASELGYVVKGELRVSIVSPDGTVDTFKVREGDVYYVPASYPHHIENVGEEEAFLLMFYNQATAGLVGFSSSISAFPNGVLAPSLAVNATQMPSLPFYPAHQGLIVHMNNPE